MARMENKVLVSTVDCWNDKIGSNTMSSLLKKYPTNNIANIYIRSDIPNSSVCRKYFQICENSVLKSIIFPNYITGKFFTGEEKSYSYIDEANQKAEKNIYKYFRKHRFWMFLFAREFVWKLGNWKSKELDAFIDAFKPDVIFFPIEGYIHFNRINEYIIQKTGIKAIGFVWDDNFTYKPSNNIWFKLHRYYCKKSIRTLINSCTTVFSINPKLKYELDKEFGIKSILLTKPIDFEGKTYTKIPINRPIKIVYTGNLFIGRDQTLCRLVNSIKKINKDATFFQLDIYTSTQVSNKLYRQLNVDNCSNMKGQISQTEVFDVQKNADILLFAEALDGRYKNNARLSFSTKITDYLGTGKCIFAIGPKEIAPIEYLIENNCALVASNDEEIYCCLSTILKNTDLLNSMGQRSYEIGHEKHNINQICEKLYSSFEA